VLPTGLHSKLAFDRLVFFSDAVFAIAITLLALELRLPEGIVAGDDALWRAILGLWPRYLSFLVSFLVIGLFWIGHHRMFRLINRFDDALLWINLLFLMCIVVIPYPTSVLGEHPGTRPAVILYAGILATTGLLQTGIWLYATTRPAARRHDVAGCAVSAARAPGDCAGVRLADGVSRLHGDCLSLADRGDVLLDPDRPEHAGHPLARPPRAGGVKDYPAASIAARFPADASIRFVSATLAVAASKSQAA
jgi:TMEM175 potassium channel family protein